MNIIETFLKDVVKAQPISESTMNKLGMTKDVFGKEILEDGAKYYVVSFGSLTPPEGNDDIPTMTIDVALILDSEQSWFLLDGIYYIDRIMGNSICLGERPKVPSRTF